MKPLMNAFHLRRDGVHIDPLVGEKHPLSLDVVNAGGLAAYRFKSRRGELGFVFGLPGGARDASESKEHVAPDEFGHGASCDHIGRRQAAVRGEMQRTAEFAHDDKQQAICGEHGAWQFSAPQHQQARRTRRQYPRCW